jgi:hypothetical protein
MSAAAAVLFYDPVLQSVASPMDYAVGKSNGHPAIPLDQAVTQLAAEIRAQVERGTEVIAGLTDLVGSIEENASMSTLRHREAAVSIRVQTDALIAALRRREESLIADIEHDAEEVQRHLFSKRDEARSVIAALTRSTNTLRDHVEAGRASHPTAPAAVTVTADGKDNETPADAATMAAANNRSPQPQSLAKWNHQEILVALATSRKACDTAAGRFTLPNDTQYTVSALNDPNSTAASLLLVEPTCVRLHFRPERFVATSTMPHSVVPDGHVGGSAFAFMNAMQPVTAPRPVGEWTRDDVRCEPTPVAGAIVPRGMVHHLCSHVGVDGTRSFGGFTEAAVDGFDIIPSVPVTSGGVDCLAQPRLFVAGQPGDVLASCRLASVPGATLWFDFGASRKARLTGYALVHGATNAAFALRSWSVVGSDEAPVAVTAAEIAADREAAVTKLGNFVSQHATVIDKRDRDARLGKAPFNAVQFDLKSLPHPPRAFRYVGICVDGPNAAGSPNFHLVLAGVEWYGQLCRSA